MKQNIRKKIYLDITLDSSEALMFNKGGKHTIFINAGDLIWFDEDHELVIPEVEVSVQMERNELGRYNFVTQKLPE